jgi:hypothetical protein
MRLRGLKKYAIGAGAMLVLVIAVVLATGSGAAVAAQISSVFVTNDTSHPVPVHEQGTASVNVTNSNLVVHEQQATQLIQLGDLSASNPALPPIDVSAYREIRIVHGAVRCNGGSDPYFVEATEPSSQNRFLVAGGNICGSNSVNDLIEVPGRTIQISCSCQLDDGTEIAVFGRTN